MTSLVAVGVLILSALSIVCFAACKIRAKSFEVSTSVWKIASFSIKIISADGENRESARDRACTTSCSAAARSSGPRVTSTSSRRKPSRRPRTATGRRADPHTGRERRPSVAGGRELQPRDGLPVDNQALSTGAGMSSSSATMPGLPRPATTNEKGVRARRPSYIRARTPVCGVNGSVVAAPGTAGR
jgi:hypothetical protein